MVDQMAIADAPMSVGDAVVARLRSAIAPCCFVRTS
jgi:hypothetical protein